MVHRVGDPRISVGRGLCVGVLQQGLQPIQFSLQLLHVGAALLQLTSDEVGVSQGRVALVHILYLKQSVPGRNLLGEFGRCVPQPRNNLILLLGGR